MSLTVVYLVTEGLQKPSFLVSHINHIYVSLTVKYKFSLITTTLCTGSDINETPLISYWSFYAAIVSFLCCIEYVLFQLSLR